MKEKLIYEKKYPPFDYMKQYEHDKAEVEKNPNAKKADVRDFFEAIYANTRYIPIPKRMDESKDFIKEAIEVSELYEMDARITEFDYMISVHLSLDFAGDMEHISRLFGMADRISFFKDKSEHDLAVCLNLYTHVVIRNELAVAP